MTHGGWLVSVALHALIAVIAAGLRCGRDDATRSPRARTTVTIGVTTRIDVTAATTTTTTTAVATVATREQPFILRR